MYGTTAAAACIVVSVVLRILSSARAIMGNTGGGGRGQRTGCGFSSLCKSRHSSLLETGGHGNGELGFFMGFVVFSHLAEIPCCKYDTGSERGADPGGVCLCRFFPFVVPLAATAKRAGNRPKFLGFARRAGSGCRGLLNGFAWGSAAKLVCVLDKFRASGSEGVRGKAEGGGGGDDSHDIYVWRDNVLEPALVCEDRSLRLGKQQGDPIRLLTTQLLALISCELALSWILESGCWLFTLGLRRVVRCLHFDMIPRRVRREVDVVAKLICSHKAMIAHYDLTDRLHQAFSPLFVLEAASRCGSSRRWKYKGTAHLPGVRPPPRTPHTTRRSALHRAPRRLAERRRRIYGAKENRRTAGYYRPAKRPRLLSQTA